MSHHYSGPNFGFPRGDARLDLTDLYAFSKSDEHKTVLVMNVHPSATAEPPGLSTTSEPFAPEARYEIRIDTNGDNVADLTYRLCFHSSADGSQTAMLTRIAGVQTVNTAGSGLNIVEAAPVSIGHDTRITDAGQYRCFAGWRSDPFFFDTLGALNNLQFTGTDFFADKNVCSIVLEVPNSDLGNKQVGLWARTVVKEGGTWVQADRGGRPAQAVFLAGDARETYMASEPADDSRFVAVFAHSLEHAGGYSAEEAMCAAQLLLPDVLGYDPNRPARFPHNGRALTDDALDWFLTILTNGKVTEDKVGPHRDLLSEFPYLGPPHTV